MAEAICGLMDILNPSSNLGSYCSLITHVKDRLCHDRRYAINAKKIISELGYAPAESFKRGLRKTVEWYLANQDWCKKVTNEKYRVD